VVVPALRPSVLAGSLLVALYVISDFGAVSLMQYPTLTRSIYLRYETLFDRTSAAALALILVAMTALVLLLEGRLQGRAAYYRSSPGAAREATPVRLGRWRWVALGAALAPVGLFLLLPLAVLGYWASQSTSLGTPVEIAWRAAANAAVVSAVAAGAAVVAALPIALLAQRHRSLSTRTLEGLAYAANALPGIVIALSLVYFGARYATFAYQTLGLLVFAYVVRFLPQALAGISSSLRLVNPRLEEAARSLGRGPAAVALTVTARVAQPGLLAGAALVFLSALKELPATLLLRPIGFETLATEIWTATSIGSYSEAALPALLLIVLAGPFLFLLMRTRRIDTATPG
jgi:iron(III) transport system permease protein